MSNVNSPEETPEAGNLREQISSMMDGELNAEGCSQVLMQVHDANGNGAMCWEHYHLMGDAMRNNLPEIVHAGLASGITAAIAHEAPHAYSEPAVPAVESATVSHITPALTQPRSPVLGYAIAASISAIAMVGLFQLNKDELLSSPMAHSQSVASNQQQPPLGSIAWSSQSKQEPIAVGRAQALVEGRYPLSRIPNAKLHRYLVNHNEQSIGMPTQGAMLPYARLVGYDRVP